MESKKQVMNRKYPCTEPGPSSYLNWIIMSICIYSFGPHEREDKRTAGKRC